MSTTDKRRKYQRQWIRNKRARQQTTDRTVEVKRLIAEIEACDVQRAALAQTILDVRTVEVKRLMAEIEVCNVQRALLQAWPSWSHEHRLQFHDAYRALVEEANRAEAAGQ